jgi:hypothetical protein
VQQRGANLADIVRRDAGRHADGDAGGAVGEQIGKARRQDHRLAVVAVIGRAEIDRILVEPVEHRRGDRRQAALGIAHRRGVIAVDIAEIALPVDQRIALGEILGEADQRLVDRDLAVRVEAADHVADDAGAFLVAGGGIETQFAHRVEDAAMHRLQPVAHIRQRARHDRRQRVGQVALAERVGEVDIADFAHEASVAAAAWRRRRSARRSRASGRPRP